MALGRDKPRYVPRNMTTGMCFADYLPQDRGILHPDRVSCQSRGDRIFGVLCAMSRATSDVQQLLFDSYSPGQVSGCLFESIILEFMSSCVASCPASEAKCTIFTFSWDFYFGL